MEVQQKMLSLSLMKQRFSLLVLSFVLLTLCGCDITQLIQESIGVYSGQTLKGQRCEVTVSMMPLPTGFCRWVFVSISIEGVKEDITESKKFCVNSGSPFQNTKYAITQGDINHPRQIKFDDSMMVNLQNQRLRALAFLDTQKTCYQLERK